METEKCKTCGALLTEKAKFCPECGTQIPQIKQDEPENASVNEPSYEASAGVKPEEKLIPVLNEKSEKAEQPEDQYQTARKSQNRQYTGAKEQFDPYITPPPSDSKYVVTGMWGFIGMMILFSLPLIGFIIAIIWACDSNNINRSNYARAVLLMIAISLLLGILIIVVGFVLYYDAIVQIIQTYSQKGFSFPLNDFNIQINSGAFICRYIGDIKVL